MPTKCAIAEAYHVDNTLILHVCRLYGPTGCEHHAIPDDVPRIYHDVFTYPAHPDDDATFAEHLSLCVAHALSRVNAQVAPAYHTSNISHLVGMTLGYDDTD